MKIDRMGLYAWQEILPRLKHSCASDIAKQLDIQPAHVYNLIDEFEKKKWLKRERHGRIVLCKFTDKGLQVANTCETLIKLVK